MPKPKFHASITILYASKIQECMHSENRADVDLGLHEHQEVVMLKMLLSLKSILHPCNK